MSAPRQTAEPPLGGADVEPIEPIELIELVLGRLAPLDLDAMSGAACARWAADAARVTGWLAVMRPVVEQERLAKELDRLLGPEPACGDEAGDDVRDDDADTESRPEPPPDRRRSAKEKARDAKVARAVALLPSFRAQLERGELTAEHVVALDALRNRGVAREREAELLAAALAHTAEGFAAWLRIWDAEVDLELGRDLAGRQQQARRLHLFDRTGDLGELRGALPPAEFDALKRTLEAIDAELRRRPGHDLSASYAQRMADALVELVHRARGAGDAGGAGGAGSLRTAVVVLIDHADLVAGTGHGTTVDGTPVPVGEVRRLAVTEHLIPVVLGSDGAPLHLGRSQRYASDVQWLALLARDGGCVLCDAPLGPLDAHHVRLWASGGSTDLHELAVLCRRCHRHVHAAGITLEVRNGVVLATACDGRPVPTRGRRSGRGAASARGAPGRPLVSARGGPRGSG